MSLVSAGSAFLSKYTIFPFVNKMFFTGFYSRKTHDPKCRLSLKKITKFEVQSCPRVVRLGIASRITKSVIISAGVQNKPFVFPVGVIISK